MDEQETGPKHEKLLQEIRERYKYASEKWDKIRKEAQIDMRYISGDPWTPEDRNARKDAGRPCINHDELNQWCNQAINNVRQTPPGIKIEPVGNGASEKSAELLQDLIRGIEYRSDAQSAYITAFQSALQQSYGFFRISRAYVNSQSFDQEIKIKAILNPDSVLFDPDCKEPDWSDAKYCFLLDPLTKEEFKRRYPKAEKVSFSSEDLRVAGDWIKGDIIMVAEYWKVNVAEETVEYEGRKRSVEKLTVTQYVTNGVEILDETPQPGTHVGIIPVLGKEIYVDEGSGPERRLISLIRLARDPQMSLAYVNTLEMEEAGLTPKVPYIGYKGQFESDAETWDTLTKQAYSHAEVDVVVDGSGNPLPLPQRVTFVPNFQAYEIYKDSCRRAIMSAIGIAPLPTAAQRNNEKSGKALEKIEQQQAVGSFHFLSNLHRGIKLGGTVMLEYVPVVYDTEREVPTRTAEEKHKVIKINTDQPYQNEQGENEHYPIGEGDHDVTISVGPSSDSTREAASDFLDLVVNNLKGLPLAPPQAAKLLSLAIKGKQLGVLGDQMAEIISPEDQNDMPPEAQAAISQAQQQIQALNAYAQQKEQEVQKLEFEKKAEILKYQQQLEIKRLELEADIAKAEITTKAQVASEREAFVNDIAKQVMSQIHEQQMQSGQQAHDAATTAVEQQHETQQQSADHQQQQALAEQQAANAQVQQQTQIQADQQSQA
jgi:hypothetical protein